MGGADGWWLYCLVSADHAGPPPDLDGVALGRRPQLLVEGDLGAVASQVPLDEFGEEGLKHNLNDLEWLERIARAHEAVLDAALADGPIVPMRVCTIYRSEEHVRETLAERGEELSNALARLQGRTEWGVKMLLSADRLDALARELTGAADEAGGGEGAAYLARKKRDRTVRDEAERVVNQLVTESHARIDGWATASAVLPPQRKELSGHEGEMVFNAAYLVEDERIDSFENVLRELERQYEELELNLELTGPWPAYHFVEP